MNEQNKNSFDELVAGISDEERQFLLAKLNANREESIPLLQPIRENVEFNPLEISLKKEPLIYRFFIWIRSLITKKSNIQVYNSDLVADLKRKIIKNHPGILDARTVLLQSLFFEKLKQLKDCADFFKPYFSAVEENPGKFYVFLSTFVAPEISKMINTEADPFLLPLEKEPTKELRTSLLKRMETVIKDVSSDTRAKLYAAVQSLHWLDSFIQLPYLHFIAQFTAIISESYTCPYVNAQCDYPTFATVLSGAKPVNNEALEALFLYTRKNSGIENEDTEKSVKEFLAKSAANISLIQMFISTVPLESLGKVIFSDYDWQCGIYGGAEDWFVKFKEEWKCIFDLRWAQWLRSRKKAQLENVLKQEFSISSFPELPYRPWATLWGGVPFSCEMTAGFLYWFSLEKFSEIIEPLNILVLEGIFINNENRAELSEAVNDFDNINQKIEDFVHSLSSSGSLGTIFQKIADNHLRTMKAQSQIDALIINAETSVRTWEKKFCETCRTFERIFNGIMDEKKQKGYESIQNFVTIKGRENRAFRESLENARKILNEAKNVLSEIEPLELENA